VFRRGDQTAHLRPGQAGLAGPQPQTVGGAGGRSGELGEAAKAGDADRRLVQQRRERAALGSIR
jgi:hypothetical protein